MFCCVSDACGCGGATTGEVWFVGAVDCAGGKDDLDGKSVGAEVVAVGGINVSAVFCSVCTVGTGRDLAWIEFRGGAPFGTRQRLSGPGGNGVYVDEPSAPAENGFRKLTVPRRIGCGRWAVATRVGLLAGTELILMLDRAGRRVGLSAAARPEISVSVEMRAAAMYAAGDSFLAIFGCSDFQISVR
jgi:hypothetical protein